MPNTSALENLGGLSLAGEWLPHSFDRTRSLLKDFHKPWLLEPKTPKTWDMFGRLHGPNAMVCRLREVDVMILNRVSFSSPFRFWGDESVQKGL